MWFVHGSRQDMVFSVLSPECSENALIYMFSTKPWKYLPLCVNTSPSISSPSPSYTHSSDETFSFIARGYRPGTLYASARRMTLMLGVKRVEVSGPVPAPAGFGHHQTSTNVNDLGSVFAP